MFRLKDHIISLMAVFLALGVGILIGTGLSEDMLVRQQRLMIEQMTLEYRHLREERSALELRCLELSQELDFWSRFYEALYPSLVEGVLNGKKVTLVCQGAQVPQAMMEVLRDSGAQIARVVIVDGAGEKGEQSALMAEAIAALVLYGPLAGRHLEVLDSLLAAKKIHFQGKWTERPDAVLLLVGDGKGAGGQLSLSMAQVLLREKTQLVALESSDTNNSLLADIKELGVPTIDNVDTVFGQYSLLAVLQGKNGHFGFKSAAEQLVPGR